MLLAKRENTKIAFLLKCCISALPEFNQSPLDFFSLFDSRLILMLLYDSLSLIINAVSLGLLGAWLRKKEVENCVACAIHECSVF